MDPAILNAISLESTSWYDPSTSSRSEEHTSELQSRLHLVCRLLLAKKTTIRPLRISERLTGSRPLVLDPSPAVAAAAASCTLTAVVCRPPALVTPILSL